MIAEDSLSLGGIVQWTILFNKGTPMADSAMCLPLDKQFGLTPYRTESSLRRVAGGVLKFTREYRGI